MNTWQEAQREHARAYWSELHKACEGCVSAMARAAATERAMVRHFVRLFGLAPSSHRSGAGAKILGQNGLIELYRPRKARPLRPEHEIAPQARQQRKNIADGLCRRGRSHGPPVPGRKDCAACCAKDAARYAARRPEGRHG